MTSWSFPTNSRMGWVTRWFVLLSINSVNGRQKILKLHKEWPIFYTKRQALFETRALSPNSPSQYVLSVKGELQHQSFSHSASKALVYLHLTILAPTQSRLSSFIFVRFGDGCIWQIEETKIVMDKRRIAPFLVIEEGVASVELEMSMLELLVTAYHLLWYPSIRLYGAYCSWLFEI